MNDDRDDERIGRILRPPATLPAIPPFEQLASRGQRGRRPLGRSVAVTIATVVIAIVTLIAGSQLATVRQERERAASSATGRTTARLGPTLPEPILQPITRTSPAAQVAWVGVYAQGQPPGTFVGVDPRGTIVGQLQGGPYWRSADGALLYARTGNAITAYSAADGRPQRVYPRNMEDAVVAMAFSPNGRWLALIGAAADIQVIDAQSGAVQTTPLGGAVTGGVYGSTLLFSADSARLYTLLDPAGPMSITAFDVTPTGLVQTGRAVDGQEGASLPPCAGLAPKIVGGDQTLALFCHGDGLIELIDLRRLTAARTVHAEQRNPFWLSPIFTPDGQLLYLHQLPAFGDLMQVVDLRSGTLLGPVPTPTTIDQPGPFSWLSGIALAGGVASTVPVAPDGSKLYAASGGGITTLRIPDLKPLAKLAPGIDIDEVWVSGDGRTIFATAGATLYVIPERGGPSISVDLPAQTGGFIASEHG